MKTSTIIAAAFTLVTAATPAAAVVITSLPDGVARTMPAANATVPGPVAFGDGVTFESHSPGGGYLPTSFGRTDAFAFANSGVWSGVPAAMVGYSSAVMDFSFDDPVSAVLAELNWARVPGVVLTLFAYDASGRELEKPAINTVDPNFHTGFYGFQQRGTTSAGYGWTATISGRAICRR